VRTGAASLLTAFLVTGCATPVPPEEMGAAFGRVQYLQDGAEVTFESSPRLAPFIRQDVLRIVVRPAAGGEAHSVPVESDGSFYLPLPAGEHLLIGYQRTWSQDWKDPLRRYSAGRIMAPLSVTKREAIYLGDLRIERRGRAARIDVLDQEESTRQRLAPRLAEGKLTLRKALARPEQQPGRFARVTAICGGSWAIACDGNHHGVRPLQPNALAWTYPQVDSVTPSLEWTPSSRAGVTYDVALYEYIEGFGSPQGLLGPLVAYAERLQDPRYTPPALKRGQGYRWSVRLRDGDTVSSWSTTSQTAVLPAVLPGMFFLTGGSSSGQIFGFETPPR